jgi:hypothetical protein
MTMTTEIDNRMVWDRRKAGHYEVWYCTLNHRPSGTGYWIRYTLESPLPGRGDAYCQLWFAFFDAEHPERNWAVNRKVPLGQLGVQIDPFELRIADALLRHGELKGTISGDAHQATWDLAFKPAAFTHRHLPDLVYQTTFADTTVLSPNLMIHLNGTVEVDGERYTFEGAPGCQTHIWGRKHAHAWAWSHCNAFREDPTACIETLSVRLKRFGLVTPTLTLLSLYLGSEVYHFNQFRALPRTRGRWETGLYSFSAVGNRVKIEGEMRCRPEDLIQAAYVDPDGEYCFCHNTEVADSSITVWTRRSIGTKFKRLARLTSRGTAHFEYVGRSPDGRVTKRHVTVG